jgi:Xaa-Pro aminopeptidase
MFKLRKISDEKIPGTDIPNVSKTPAESAADKSWMARVAVTTAILATLASLSSMFATNHLNQGMLEEVKTSNQWAYFQAKGLKLAVLESKMELLPTLGKANDQADVGRAARYVKEQEEIKGIAEAHQAAAADHRWRQGRLSHASTAYQVSIALCAVALLTRRNQFWLLSLLGAAVGTVFFLMGLLG